MSGPPGPSAGAAERDAARLLLARLGLSPRDLLQSGSGPSPPPTFADYLARKVAKPRRCCGCTPRPPAAAAAP
jgi:hypothetical protein